jgi:hypothetical protein
VERTGKPIILLNLGPISSPGGGNFGGPECHLRTLAATLVFQLPVVSDLARKSGSTLACNDDIGAVLAAGGLLGVVVEVDQRYAQAIDWTHPDFGASAMTADGEAYGMVYAQRGRFREEDYLVLRGTPFHVDIPPGTRIVTSGRGGVYRRGIPIGTVIGIEDADTGWRKSYLLSPAVRPQSVGHALVTRTTDAEAGDLAPLWPFGVPPDTAAEGNADTTTPESN